MNGLRCSHSVCRILLILSILCGLAGGRPRRARADDAPSELEHYLSGNGLLNRGHYALAAGEYRKFLAVHPRHDKAPVARYGLGVSLYGQAEYDQALAELRRITRAGTFEYAAEVQALKGQCLFALARYGDAARAFGVFIEQFSDHALAEQVAAQGIESWYRADEPRHATALYQAFAERFTSATLHARAEMFAGLAGLEMKSEESALPHFAVIVEQFPESAFYPQAAVLLARCQHSMGQLEPAYASYRKVQDQKLEPYVSEALYGEALVLKQLGRLPEAAGLFDRYVTQYPDAPQATAARLYRGQCWLDSGRPDRAVAEFESALADGGDILPEASFWLAKAHARLGHHEQAARILHAAMEAHPGSSWEAEMLLDLALAQLELQHDQRADKILQRFLEAYPTHSLAPEALYLQALAAHRQGDYQNSTALCRTHQTRFPNAGSARAVAFLLAENAYLAEQYGPAASSYAAYIESYPDDAQVMDARYRLGLSYYYLGRLDDAVMILDGPAATIADARYFLGDVHFQRGEWEQACRALEQYLSEGQDDTYTDAALLRLGLCHLRGGHPRQAISSFDRLIASSGTGEHRLQALFERGQAYLALGEHQQAADSLETVLHEGGQSRFSAYASTLLGQLKYQQGDYEGAIRQFVQTAESAEDPQQRADALLRSAQSLSASGQHGRAAQLLERFLSRYAAHERALEARAMLIIALARQGQDTQALEHIEVFEKLPDHESSTAYAKVLYEKAWAHRRMGHNAQAAPAYRRLIEIGEDADLKAHAFLELSELKANDEEWEQALAWIEHFLSFVAGDVSRFPELIKTALYRQGLYLFELQRYDEAATVLESFIAQSSGHADLASGLYLCAESCFKLGKHGRAVENFQRLVDEFPGDAFAEPALLRLGESLGAMQQWARSEQVFSQYSKQFSDRKLWFQAQFGVGWALENQKRTTEAIQAYRLVTARHQGPTAARAQFQIGQCFFADHAYQKAATELLKVEILYEYTEWSAAALYEAGRCFEFLGDKPQAMQQFMKVASEYRDTRWASLASAKLQDASAVGSR